MSDRVHYEKDSYFWRPFGDFGFSPCFLGILRRFCQGGGFERFVWPLLSYLWRTYRPYSQTQELFPKFQKWRGEKGLQDSEFFGIYYDDPEKVPEEKLRSEIGVSLSKTDYEKFSQKNQKEKIKGIETKFKTLLSKEYIFTKIPYRNMLSIFVGIMKAYPALDEYAKSQGMAEYTYREEDYNDSYAMELYKDSEIFYLITINK